MNCWTWDFHFVFPWGRHWTNHDKSTICCSWNLHVSGYVGLFRTLKGNSQEWDDLFQFQLVVKHGPWTSQQQRLLGFNLWVWEWCVIFFCPAQKPERNLVLVDSVQSPRCRSHDGRSVAPAMLSVLGNWTVQSPAWSNIWLKNSLRKDVICDIYIDLATRFGRFL
jgi:hypothetical protein